MTQRQNPAIAASKSPEELDKTLPQALAKKENLPVTKIYKARPPPFKACCWTICS